MSRSLGFRSTPRRPFVACLSVLALTLLVPLVGPSPVRADSHEAGASVDPNIKYRQALMSVIGANMGAIGDIAKGQLDLPKNLESHARQISLDSELIASAFRKEVSDGPTDAKPKIWQDWAKFEQAIVDLREAANGLAQTVADGGDGAAVGAAIKGLGKSCGGCHKPFRKPKEESYKNQ
jgi:cytochrome c556